MEGEKEEKGFIVRDKRHVFQQEEKESPAKEGKPMPGEAAAEEKPREERAEAREKKKDEQEREIPLPEITFSNFVFSLSTQALIQLGEIQDPESRKTLRNLSLAKQTIDLIGILKEKTKGNLTKEEEALVDNALYDLRMRYVKASS